MSPIQFRRALASLGMLAVLATFAPVHAANIQILDPDGACASWTTGGTAQSPTLTCNKAPTSTGGVPVCSVTADGVNPLTISAPKLVVLSASCTNVDSNTTYTWSGGTVSGSASSQSLQVSATTTFSVVATNASGPSGSKSVTVTLGSTAPPPAPPPSGALSCPGYNNTYVVDLKYQRSGDFKDVGTFGQGDLLIARFTTPTTLANRGAEGLIAVGEYAGNGEQFYRTAVLSATPCSFTAAGNALATGTGPTVYFNNYPLSPGTTYYFQINNTYRGSPSCNDGNCPVRVTLAGTD